MRMILNIKMLTLTLVFLLTACTEGYLDTKPHSGLVVPETLDEIQQLLENYNIVNATGSLSHLSADEYQFVDENTWKNAGPMERNAYVWARDIYEGVEGIRDWSFPYSSIFYANNAIEMLKKFDPKSVDEQARHDFLMGWALFTRAYSHFDLLKHFAPIYDEATASADLGVPLRTKAGIDELEERATVSDCYMQLFQDLQKAETLLPVMFHTTKRNHPSKLAVHGLRARIYLYMGEYEQALSASESFLSEYDELIDYNKVDLGSESPFSRYNAETVFSTDQVLGVFATVQSRNNTWVTVDPALLALYDDNDLRLQAFFGWRADGTTYKKQGYNASNYPFSGIATDEIHLIRAECLARAGFQEEAMNALTNILSKRVKTGNLDLSSFQSATDALDFILLERRKQLVWRGIRWMDLKRLNREGAEITLERWVGNQRYELPPNDPKWVLPIPDEEITRSNIKQNIR